jgi:GDPmannose 4,6-dehydratase
LKALITGALGQDGTLLSQLLLSRGYEVIGVDVRECETGRMRVRQIDISDADAINNLVRRENPDEVYHLAARHHSAEGTTDAETEREMVSTNFISTQNLIAALLHYVPTSRFLLAASSQMYRARQRGDVVNEDTAIDPPTFYGLTKMWSWDLVKWARVTHHLHANTAILFNHESPLRPASFVSRKITRAAAEAWASPDLRLSLRDIDAETDWSSARDIVLGMSAMLSAPEPGDYVLASGTLHSVKDILEIAFSRVGLDWRKHVKEVQHERRPTASLVGDTTRARRALGWSPTTSFERMIQEMVDHDLALIRSPARVH